MKTALSFLFILVFTTASFSQSLKKFDMEKFNDLLFNNDFQDLGSSIINIDTSSFTRSEMSDMKVFTPHGKMAPMSNMEIRKDVNYTLRIKRYSNKYPFLPSDNTQKGQPGIDRTDPFQQEKIEKER